jgi:hypothetical protein
MPFSYLTGTKKTRMKIRRFEDLKVWQLSHKLSIEIAELVKSFPRDEKYDLGGQMRRSARSIPSDISEGFGRFHFTLWNIFKVRD